MASADAEGEYQPAQYPKEGGLLEVDFRSMAASADRSSIPNRDRTHSSGGKRKRDADEEGAAQGMDADAMQTLPSGEPQPKRRAYDNVSGKVSGRPWKARFTRASAIANRPPSDWEKRMTDKAQRKAIQDHIGGARADAKATAKAERKRRDEIALRRETNRQAALKVQTVSNPKTLKKLSKKKAAQVWATQKLGPAPAAKAAVAAPAPKRKGGKKKSALL